MFILKRVIKKNLNFLLMLIFFIIFLFLATERYLFSETFTAFPLQTNLRLVGGFRSHCLIVAQYTFTCFFFLYTDSPHVREKHHRHAGRLVQQQHLNKKSCVFLYISFKNYAICWVVH